MKKNEPVTEINLPVSTSVSFEYQAHRVEYGAVRRAGAIPCPFVRVDGVEIVLTPELRYGWEIQEFGEAVRAYMKQNYPLN